MAIYLCFGCDEYKNSDDGCFGSIVAELREKGEKKYQCVCEECHEKEVEKICVP